jgi:hypothetical protein
MFCFLYWILDVSAALLELAYTTESVTSPLAIAFGDCIALIHSFIPTSVCVHIRTGRRTLREVNFFSAGVLDRNVYLLLF